MSFNLYIEIKTDDNKNYITEMVKECIYTNKIEGIYQGIKWQLNKITEKLRLTSTDETPEKETDWKDCKEYIRMVSMDNTMTYIPNLAFYGCNALSRINIPNNVTSINEYAFDNFTSLEKIYCTQGSYADTWLQYNGYTNKIVYI